MLLEHFAQVNASVYSYKTPNSAPKASNLTSTNDLAARPKAPDVILLLSWSGANLRHLAKYVPGYLQLYPNAQIILVTSTFTDFIYGNSSGQRDQLKPVIEAITSEQEPVVLTHLFSNGGSHKLWRIAQLYKATTGQLLPMGMLVLDSAPGRTTFKRSVDALAHELPKAWYLRLPSLALVHLILSLLWVVLTVTGRVNTVDRVWKELNWPNWINVKAFRCYIYSRADRLVWWQDIEDHADEAEAKGYRVRKETFNKTEHVAHMRSDTTRYWRIVNEAWGQR